MTDKIHPIINPSELAFLFADTGACVSLNWLLCVVPVITIVDVMVVLGVLIVVVLGVKIVVVVVDVVVVVGVTVVLGVKVVVVVVDVVVVWYICTNSIGNSNTSGYSGTLTVMEIDTSSVPIIRSILQNELISSICKRMVMEYLFVKPNINFVSGYKSRYGEMEAQIISFFMNAYTDFNFFGVFAYAVLDCDDTKTFCIPYYIPFENCTWTYTQKRNMTPEIKCTGTGTFKISKNRVHIVSNESRYFLNNNQSTVIYKPDIISIIRLVRQKEEFISFAHQMEKERSLLPILFSSDSESKNVMHEFLKRYMHNKDGFQIETGEIFDMISSEIDDITGLSADIEKKAQEEKELKEKTTRETIRKEYMGHKTVTLNPYLPSTTAPMIHIIERLEQHICSILGVPYDVFQGKISSSKTNTSTFDVFLQNIKMKRKNIEERMQTLFSYLKDICEHNQKISLVDSVSFSHSTGEGLLDEPVLKKSKLNHVE
jgi:hypothetical protein